MAVTEKKNGKKSKVHEAASAAIVGSVAEPWANWPIEQVALADIGDDGQNHRDGTLADSPKVAGLAEAMRVVGLQQPILVCTGIARKYRRVFGSRRCAAAVKLGWKTIAARVCPVALSDEEVQELRAIENVYHEALTASEEALAAQQLVDAGAPLHGLDQAIVRAAAVLGLTEAVVRDRICVMGRIAPAVKVLLGGGQVNLAQARELVQLPPEDQERCAEQIAESYAGGRIWRVAEVQAWIANKKRSLRIVPWELGAEMKTRVAGCVKCLGCPYNTATDMELFHESEQNVFMPKGGDGDDARAGFCTHGAGYEAKQALVAKATRKTAEQISRKVTTGSVAAAEAGNLDLVRKLAPEFVNAASAQRAVRKALGMSQEKSADKMGTNRAAGLSDVQKALLAWSRAFDAWAEEAARRVLEKIEQDGFTRVVALLLKKSGPMADVPRYEVVKEEYYFQHEKWKNAAAPAEEEGLRPKAARMLYLVEEITSVEGTKPGDLARQVGGLRELGEMMQWESYDEFDLNSLPYGPVLIARVAGVFGVTLEAAPAWEEFKPGGKARAEEKPAETLVSGKTRAEMAALLTQNGNGRGLELRRKWLQHCKGMSPEKPQEILNAASAHEFPGTVKAVKEIVAKMFGPEKEA